MLQINQILIFQPSNSQANKQDMQPQYQVTMATKQAQVQMMYNSYILINFKR